MRIFTFLFICLTHLVYCHTLKTKFNSVFAFGDSYTDNGSLNTFYSNGSTRIDTTSLNPKESEHTKRYSDGPLWVEYLTELLNGIDLYDFARSGATANNNITSRSTQDIDTQISTYLKTDISSETKNQSLYFLWTGVNDMNDIFKMHPADSDERRTKLTKIVQTIRNDVDKLYDAGARYIIILGLIPLDDLPMYVDYPIEARGNLISLISEYNSRLASLAGEIKTKDNLQSSFFDTHTLFKTVFSPEILYQNAIEHCELGKNCDKYIWWDKLHPSSKTHSVIGKAVFNFIQSLGW